MCRLHAGFHEVEDKAKTAFSVGFYKANRVPFGLVNALATFQSLMERCMGELNLHDCLIDLDDVVAFINDFQSHISKLDAIFSRL